MIQVPSRESLLDLLHTHWGYPGFRPLQEEVITHILQGGDAIALMPTGGGKSLCYQLPAIAQRGCCLVISPLIALMEDQVTSLLSRSIEAVALHGGMTAAALQNAVAGIREGLYKIVYCSPERLQTKAFRDLLTFMRLSLIAIDEAHCVAQWGHDFRPEYLEISWLPKLFPKTPMLALTATATPEVVAQMRTGLGLRNDHVFRQSFARPNIFYEMRQSERKQADTIQSIRDCAGSAIVYCRSRGETESVRHALEVAGLMAVHYHAGMKADARTAGREAWMEGRAQAIVATTAFGMGIDKPDVRLVLHYEPPGDLESWYQETGRAGRDGLQATALTLYDTGDIRKLKASTKTQYPPAEYLREVYQAVAEYLQVPISAQPDRYYPFDLADFCRKFSLRPTAVAPALRLLAQEGLWTLTDGLLRPPPAHFTTSRQRLDEFILQYPALGNLATALLRLYAGIFTHPVAVYLSQVAHKIRWTEEEVLKGLKELARMGIINWEQGFEGPRLFFHHYRVESKNLVLNTARMQQLRNAHEARTAAIIGFVENDMACRGAAALAYFGEVKAGDCGHCDVCRRKTLGVPDGRALTAIINDALRTATAPLSLATLTSLVPRDAQTAVLSALRDMVEAGLIAWHPDNTFSIIPKAPKRRKASTE